MTVIAVEVLTNMRQNSPGTRGIGAHILKLLRIGKKPGTGAHDADGPDYSLVNVESF
ncbi:hypothetical protein PCO31010_01445 [Pandoraea commovens]|uniref:Uncharacterized protein n=1 Tax=Pandoraea commovens TaxID=2508289 RepID=A0A5E4TJE5_9BURK|nr:hypothetical protein PCO31010_01445 [Pandoraea commovens]